MHLFAVLPSSSAFPLIISAGVATYIASKAAVDAVVGDGGPTAGRLAIGQWLPIIVLGVVAILTGRPQIAVAIVFSTAVACLSLAAGAAVFVSPLQGSPASRRCWAMIVPAALLAFLAGFGGQISAFDAAVLAIQGVCVLLLWNDRAGVEVQANEISASSRQRGMLLRAMQFLLAMALACVGAWLAIHGIELAAASTEMASPGLLTATLLSPMLVLPIIGTGSELAQKHQSSVAVSSQVGVALLNVLALLPLLVLLSYRREILWHIHELLPSMWQAMAPASGSRPIPPFNSALVFPLAVWRVDVVMMIALGLFLLPVAIGKWSLSKRHGVAMMLGYALYLILSLAIGIRKV